MRLRYGSPIRLHPVCHGYNLRGPELVRLLLVLGKRDFLVQNAPHMEDRPDQHPEMVVEATDRRRRRNRPQQAGVAICNVKAVETRQTPRMRVPLGLCSPIMDRNRFHFEMSNISPVSFPSATTIKR